MSKLQRKWKPIKEFPQDGTRCLVKNKSSNITIASWGKVSHVPLYGIIDECYADPNDLDIMVDAEEFIELNQVGYILSGLTEYLKGE